MKKLVIKSIKLIVCLYVLACVLLYFSQEKLIFFPEKLAPDYKYSFDQNFEELSIKTKDSTVLNALLFKSDSSKGVIFYLHGNAGSIASWGEVANTYTAMHYDVFMPDYRGFGKSEGTINGQDQFFQDIQTAYDKLKTIYREDKIIVLGYSIGTGPAAKIASTNHPKLLILQAPYYSLTDMMKHRFPIIPTFILKYKFETNEFIKNCQAPIVIFHGDQDEVIYYGSSLNLQKEFKTTDTLITLRGQGHNGMTDNPDYKNQIERFLR